MRAWWCAVCVCNCACGGAVLCVVVVVAVVVVVVVVAVASNRSFSCERLGGLVRPCPLKTAMVVWVDILTPVPRECRAWLLHGMLGTAPHGSVTALLLDRLRREVMGAEWSVAGPAHPATGATASPVAARKRTCDPHFRRRCAVFFSHTIRLRGRALYAPWHIQGGCGRTSHCA